MSLADQASLLFIPSGYKSQKVYSIFPTDGDGDFDFSRSGSATRIAKNGLITTVDSNVPRLEYPLIDGVQKGCPSLILEPQRTNLITYSEDFAGSGWSNFASVTPIANSTISPAGVQNASTLECSGVNVFRYSFTASSSTNYVGSVFVKAKETTNDFGIQTLESGTSYTSVFNIESGIVVTQASNHIASIEDFGNGWFRCSVKFNSGSSTSNIFDFKGSQTTVNKDFYAWGASLEVGSYPTSYIPTNGSVVTRSAETANGSGDAATFNDSEGVLMAEISALADDSTNRQITFSDGTDTNRLVLKYDNQSNVIQVFNRVNGSETAFLSVSVTDITLFSKCVLKYKLNDYSLWVNGFELATDTGTVFPSSTLNDLKFGVIGAGSNFYGNTKQLQYYDTALTDSELEQLTSWTSFTDMANGQLYTIE